MTSTDDAIFARIADRRRAIADLLDTLDEDQLATPSLCGGWDFKTVAGHLTMPLLVGRATFAATVLRHHGSFARANDEMSRRVARDRTRAELAAALRAGAEDRFTPPLLGPAAPLTDVCVHTADMVMPLGRPHGIGPDEAAIVLDFLTGFTIGFIPRGLLRGIRIAPTDLDRTWGEGADLTGTAGDIVLAVLGRQPGLAAVAGPGRNVLIAR